MVSDMKINSIVRLKPGTYYYEQAGERFIGVVVEIEEGYKPVDHGYIKICVIDSSVSNSGDIETFSYYGWQDHLEIIESDNPEFFLEG